MKEIYTKISDTEFEIEIPQPSIKKTINLDQLQNEVVMLEKQRDSYIEQVKGEITRKNDEITQKLAYIDELKKLGAKTDAEVKADQKDSEVAAVDENKTLE